MPYQEIRVPADVWVRVSQIYAVYHAYKYDEYNDPLPYSFVLHPNDEEEDSHDIREWDGYNDSETVEENIQQAFETGSIYFCQQGDEFVGWTTW